MTLMLLWEEYRAAEPDGYAYSRWCELYRAWEGRLSPTMRQSHPAGERLFVDYAGQTVEIVDGRTGEVREAQVFVAAMGASSYTYAEATWTQSLWVQSARPPFARACKATVTLAVGTRRRALGGPRNRPACFPAASPEKRRG